jgi:hypothetical protein
VARSELWFSGGYWEPPYRSWPAAPSWLEELAVRANVSDEELRELLRAAVQERLRERGEAWGRLDERLEKRANDA